MELLCPNCQQKLTIPDQYAGQLMRCPLCNGTFTAPALAPPPPPPASAPPPAPAPAPIVYPTAPAPPPPPVLSPEPFPPPPAPSFPPPPLIPPGEYTHSFGISLSGRALPWITPAALGLIFILSFLPWTATVHGTKLEEIKTGWTWGLFADRPNPIIGIYLLITLAAFLLSIPSFLFTLNLAPSPPFITTLGAWRHIIIGGIALLALVFLSFEYIDWILSYRLTPGTIWLKLALRCHIVAIAGSLLEFWLEVRRGKNLPAPRLEIRW